MPHQINEETFFSKMVYSGGTNIKILNKFNNKIMHQNVDICFICMNHIRA